MASWPIKFGLLWCLSSTGWGADAGPAILVYTNGVVTSAINVDGKQLRGRYEFALPPKPPDKRWQEDDYLPICQSRWEHEGVHYTQKVLVTRLGPGDLTLATNDAVLMIQIFGENKASDYTNATAIFAMQLEGRPVNLELRASGLVYRVGTDSLLAAVDVPSSGIAGTNGTQLQFQGSMPPGTSGALTVKIPLGRLEGKTALDRLYDLAFDDEFERVKRFWKNPANARKFPPPVGWGQ